MRRMIKSKMPGVRARTSHPVQEKGEVSHTFSVSGKEPETMNEPTKSWFMKMMKIFSKGASLRILKNKMGRPGGACSSRQRPPL